MDWSPLHPRKKKLPTQVDVLIRDSILQWGRLIDQMLMEQEKSNPEQVLLILRETFSSYPTIFSFWTSPPSCLVPFLLLVFDCLHSTNKKTTIFLYLLPITSLIALLGKMKFLLLELRGICKYFCLQNELLTQWNSIQCSRFQTRGSATEQSKGTPDHVLLHWIDLKTKGKQEMCC